MFQIPKQGIEMEWAKALAQIPDKIKHEPAKAPDYGELNQAFYQANKPLFTIYHKVLLTLTLYLIQPKFLSLQHYLRLLIWLDLY